MAEAHLMMMAMDDDSEELEHTRHLLYAARALIHIRNIDDELKRTNSKIIGAMFRRNASADIDGIILHMYNRAGYDKWLPIYGQYEVIKAIHVHYKLNYTDIITVECNYILNNIREADPNNIYPIVKVSKECEIVGIKYGKDLGHTERCPKAIADIVLTALKRPTLDPCCDCKCTIF